MFLLEEDEKVHVWKTSFLEFNGEYFCNGSAEDTILEDVAKDCFFLQLN